MSLQQGLRLIQRLGLVGALGLMLLGASVWGRWIWLPQRQAQVDELGSQVRRTRHELLDVSQRPAGAVEVLSSPDQAWRRLWQALPDASARVALQSKVLQTAQEQGLQVRAVQYQGARAAWSAREGQVLWRQRMDMPVEGAYPAVKQWMTQLLAEPALAIDAVALQRSDVMGNQVRGRVIVSLWWRQPERSKP
jgi:hypothetical protein